MPLNDRYTKHLVVSDSAQVNPSQMAENVILVNSAGQKISTKTDAELNSRYLPWQANTAYTAGTFVSHAGHLYTVDADFTSPSSWAATGLTEFSGGGGGDLTEYIGIPVGDELTTVTEATAKVTFRMPFAMTITGVRANVNTVSSSGVVTVDINEGGTTILSTKLTIDANEKTSTTAATAAVVSDTALADDAEITVDVVTAGTGAKGLKVWIIGIRPS